MSDQKRILLVGHCLPDRFVLSRTVKKAIPDASIESVNSDDALTKELDGAHALLVNRVLDGRFSAASGIDLIRAIAGAANGAAPGLVLVSNFDDAQAEARSVGALPGFGKSHLGHDSTLERIRAAAGVTESA